VIASETCLRFASDAIETCRESQQAGKSTTVPGGQEAFRRTAIASAEAANYWLARYVSTLMDEGNRTAVDRMNFGAPQLSIHEVPGA
jgi:hypothetical protein